MPYARCKTLYIHVLQDIGIYLALQIRMHLFNVQRVHANLQGSMAEVHGVMITTCTRYRGADRATVEQ